MKKLVSFIIIFMIFFVCFLSINVYAASLDTISITTTKDRVHPGENVTVNIEFGKELGSYTFDIAYDNNLFEYVSSTGGTENDDGSRVRVYFFDNTGGTNPRSNMSVTFRAKEVSTSNPTNFSITAEGLANPDASVVYDDIGTPIIKNVVVEPQYVTPDNETEDDSIDNENLVDEDINKQPETLPQTGNTIYIYIIPAILILTLIYFILKKKN